MFLRLVVVLLMLLLLGWVWVVLRVHILSGLVQQVLGVCRTWRSGIRGSGRRQGGEAEREYESGLRIGYSGASRRVLDIHRPSTLVQDVRSCGSSCGGRG